jgi:hypothetical protein
LRGVDWRRSGAAFVLLLTLLLPAQAAVALLVQGCLAVFGGQLLGFPAMGIEAATGPAAVKTGGYLIMAGMGCAVIATVGLIFSLRELRKPRTPE